MSRELTPFPDGEGYMDFAWDGLTYPQVIALFRAAGRDFNPRQTAGVATWRVLLRHRLVDDAVPRVLTDRGRALVAWVDATGRWETESAGPLTTDETGDA